MNYRWCGYDRSTALLSTRRFGWIVRLFASACLIGLLEPRLVNAGTHDEIDRATVADVVGYFRGTGKQVLTFVGYSGAGYEDQTAMLDVARRVLDRYDHDRIIVNIGATPDGIGAIYALAKMKGFATAGVVSSQAKEQNAAISPDVDKILFVQDRLWGGIDDATGRLSPTSQAMLEASDFIVAIGGGKVARDELRAARKSGKPVWYFPAEMNHAKARLDAKKSGKPEPSDFRGEAFEVSDQ